MNYPHWFDDPSIQHIDKRKLEYMYAILFELNKVPGNEKLKYLTAVLKKAKDDDIHFSTNEVNDIIEVIKKYSSEDEIKKIKNMVHMFEANKK